MESRPPVYESVSNTDDHEELLSSTEVDESVIGEEKQWYSQKHETRKRSKRNKFMSAIRSHRWLINMSLLLVIIGLLILVLLGQRKEPKSSHWQVGGDFTGAGPQFSTKVTKWEADMSFVPMNTSDFFTKETLARWNTLLPVGRGFVKGPTQTFFTTSMSHQLHCLYMMIRIYSGVVSDNLQAIPSDYHFHFLHCADYVRQAIMCSADVALEAHEPSDADDLGPLDGGWSGHHVCKDYSQVINYLEEQSANGARIVLAIDD